MNDETRYGQDLERAMNDLAKLTKQREELETQIARTKRKVALLSQLCDETGELAPIPDLDLGGLTEACATVLRGARKEWMNTTEIKEALRELGYPLDKYKAPMASITTTVSRMVDSGEVVVSPRTNPGAAEYKWVGKMPDFAEELSKYMADRAEKGVAESFQRVTVSPPAANSLAAMDADGRLPQATAKKRRRII